MLEKEKEKREGELASQLRKIEEKKTRKVKRKLSKGKNFKLGFAKVVSKGESNSTLKATLNYKPDPNFSFLFFFEGGRKEKVKQGQTKQDKDRHKKRVVAVFQPTFQ